MSEDNLEHERRIEANRWLAIALDDIAVAQFCLDAYEPKLGNGAYNCQQAVEKLLKGLLVLVDVPFPKTHDLRRPVVRSRHLLPPRRVNRPTESTSGGKIGRIFPPGTATIIHYPACAELLSATFAMTPWGYAYRYPGPEDYALPNPDELRQALATIRQIAAFMGSLLSGRSGEAS